MQGIQKSPAFLIMKKKFKVGDIVYTDTHAVYQNTQKSLSRRIGKVVNDDDYPWNIHVKIYDEKWQPVGFSEFELSHEPITEYKNEKI